MSCIILGRNGNSSGRTVAQIYAGYHPDVRLFGGVTLTPQKAVHMSLELLQEDRVVHLANVADKYGAVFTKPDQHSEQAVIITVRTFSKAVIE